MALYVTGTDTDVGKTLVSAWLCLHTRAAYFKPIQTGSDQECDTPRVREIAHVDTYPEAYRYRDAVSPHRAAQIEKRPIHLHEIQVPPTHNVVIEGAGGVYVPLNETQTMLDLMAVIKAPVILVARGSLGTINHTLLSLHALRAHNIPLCGVVMSGDDNLNNKAAIEHYGKVVVLAQIPTLQTDDLNLLRKQLLDIPCPDRIHHYLRGDLYDAA